MNDLLTELFKRPLADDSLIEAAREYLAARKAEEAAIASLTLATKAMQAAEATLMAKMDETGVKSLKVQDGADEVSLSGSTSTYYSLPAGSLDDNSVMAWLMRCGGHDLVKRTMHHGSFTHFCREVVESGRAVHPSVKKVEKRVVRVKRG